jgi:toxin-antitoxin system PIN domain toxin
MLRMSEGSAAPWQLNEAPRLPWPLPRGCGAGQGDLPDLNVWLALAIQEHPHHAAATAYWDSGTQAGSPATTLQFCRITMLGLTRLLCQPKVVGTGALSIAAAWEVYQGFRAIPRVAMAQEPTNCEAALLSYIKPLSSFPVRMWTDAYLAAFAQTSGLRLVSFDRDFERFALSNWLLLTA